MWYLCVHDNFHFCHTYTFCDFRFEHPRIRDSQRVALGFRGLFLVSANALPLMAMSVVISRWKRLSVCTCIIWGILAAGNLTRGRWTCSRLQKYYWSTFGNTCRHSAQILQTMCDYGNLTRGRWTCSRLQKYYWNTLGNTYRHCAQILQIMCDYGNLIRGRWTCSRLQIVKLTRACTLSRWHSSLLSALLV